jgi:hypothetical protein
MSRLRQNCLHLLRLADLTDKEYAALAIRPVVKAFHWDLDVLGLGHCAEGKGECDLEASARDLRFRAKKVEHGLQTCSPCIRA